MFVVRGFEKVVVVDLAKPWQPQKWVDVVYIGALQWFIHVHMQGGLLGCERERKRGGGGGGGREREEGERKRKVREKLRHDYIGQDWEGAWEKVIERGGGGERERQRERQREREEVERKISKMKDIRKER